MLFGICPSTSLTPKFCHVRDHVSNPVIPHQAGQNTPKEVLEKRALKKIPTKNLVIKILELVLNSNV